MRTPIVGENVIVRDENGSLHKENVLELNDNLVLISSSTDSLGEKSYLIESKYFVHGGSGECFYFEDETLKPQNINIGDIYYIYHKSSNFKFTKLKVMSFDDESFTLSHTDRTFKRIKYNRRDFTPIRENSDLMFQRQYTLNIKMYQLYTGEEMIALLPELEIKKLTEKISSYFYDGEFDHLSVDALNAVLDLRDCK